MPKTIVADPSIHRSRALPIRAEAAASSWARATSGLTGAAFSSMDET
jgi:hypothetical protein